MLLSVSFYFDFLPLFYIAFAAWIIPILLKVLRLNRIPCIVVEIIAGFLLGRFLLQNVPAETMVIPEFMGLLGFLFLIFMAGLEIDMDLIFSSLPRKRLSVSKVLSNPLLMGIMIYSISLLLSLSIVLGFLDRPEISNTWYFSLLLITTSLGIVVPVLKNRGELGTRFGQMVMMAAAIADIASIMMFSFTVYIIKNGFQFQILLMFLLFFLFLFLYKAGSKLKNIRWIEKIVFQLEFAASQIKIRGAMVILLGFIVAAQFIGKEIVLLGAFLGGLLLSTLLHKERSLLLLNLDGMGYGFLIPFFFVMVGVNFDPEQLVNLDPSFFLFLAFLLITLFTVKLLPSLIWYRLFGIRKALAGGLLISSRLSLIITFSKVGLDMGIITPGINAGIVLLAIITCIASPFLYNLICRNAPATPEHVLIVGGSSTGVLLSRRLKMHQKTSVILEADESRHKDMAAKGLNAIKGDAMDPDIYQKLNVNESSYVFVHTGDTASDLEVCRFLKKEKKFRNIITMTQSNSEMMMFKSIEVDSVDVRRILATTIENIILRPVTYSTLVEAFEKYFVEEILVSNPVANGKMIREIPFHKDCSLMLLKRGKSLFVPHGNTMILEGDVFAVFGSDAAIQDTKKKLM